MIKQHTLRSLLLTLSVIPLAVGCDAAIAANQQAQAEAEAAKSAPVEAKAEVKAEGDAQAVAAAEGEAAAPGAKAEVKAEIKSSEWGEYRKRMQAGEHQMGMLGWTGDNGDPDNFLHTLLGCDSAKTGGSNVAKFCYKPFDELVLKAKTVTKPAERTELYKKAQVIFKEQAPWFTIAHAVQLKPVRKEVVDFKVSPFGRHTFYGVDLKE